MSSRGVFCGEDVRRLAALVGGAALTWPLPQRWDSLWLQWAWMARGLLPTGRARDLDQRMQAALGDAPTYVPTETAAACLRMRFEDGWGRCRGMRQYGWKPAIELAGVGHVEAALKHGNGAILWSMRLASATAIKQAMHAAGHPLVHLSRATHGTRTETWLGLHTVAPLFCRVENPYLRARVQIPADGNPRYLQTLKRRLRGNELISIFGEHAGRQNVTAPVLGRPLAFGLGAPSLAWSEDAVLLTVWAHRIGPAAYRVVIDEPIQADRSVPRKQFAKAAIEEFARRLDELVLKYPADWHGWFYPEFAAPQT